MRAKYVFTLVVGGYLASCQSHRPLLIENYAQARKLVPRYERQYGKNKKTAPWLGPPPAPASYLRQAHVTGSALLLGHVEVLLEDGQLLSQPTAIVSVDNQIFFTDKAGNYAVALPPGRHTLRGGAVGFLLSQAPTLQFAAGDSVRLDFRLLAEVRPIY